MTKTRDLSDFLIEGGVLDKPIGTPHIVPGVLQPAIAGKLLNGATHSGAYGTAQTQSGGDGHKYYYTDIKGSKPIKDPRIGGHFGSQRHKTKSIQILEQETATHGENVYSVDGREWIRACGTFVVDNASYGHRIKTGTDSKFIEIVGYFNDVNYIGLATSSNKGFTTQLNGASASAENTSFETSVTSPLAGRHVDGGSVINLNLGATLGINTLRINPHSTNDNINFFGFELIAQDLVGSGSPNRSKIKFPVQNVVSYGKKFAITETNHHYNPFAFAENGTTAVAIGDNASHGKLTGGWASGGTTAQHYDSTLDTTTSLGLAAWVDSGNYYRPVNGGRVVKWVDSTGTIKTSVNMMPPSAKSGEAGSGNAGPHQTAWTTTYQPVFSSGAIDQTQAELSKSFHFREFGNGAVNGGSAATFADFSMLSTDGGGGNGTTDNVAFVMDDGLTSLVGEDVRIWDSVTGGLSGSGNKIIIGTFIGTGLTLERAPLGSDANQFDNGTMAQNLPFGTHTFQYTRVDGSADLFKIDGVQVYGDSSTNGYFGNKYFNFHQPKMPPIPEDAVVLADYMLMSDFVPMTSAGVDHISKGVRFQAQSRDYKIDKTEGTFLTDTFKSHDAYRRMGQYFWWKTTNASGDTYTQELPFFGDSFVCHYSTENDSDYANPVFTLNGSALSGFTNTGNGTGFTSVTAAGVVTETGNQAFDNVVNFKAPAGTLGSNTLKVSITSNASAKYAYNRHFSIVTPIHTSSHYQSFETPFLHELVGGDRNMEQHNLVCTPDGRSWDQITRDTSYIGKLRVMTRTSTAANSSSATLVNDNHRGVVGSSVRAYGNKDFAISFDRMICLRDGFYTLNRVMRNGGYSTGIKVNGQIIAEGDCADEDTTQIFASVLLKRGDYIEFTGGNSANPAYNFSHISRAD